MSKICDPYSELEMTDGHRPFFDHFQRFAKTNLLHGEASDSL